MRFSGCKDTTNFAHMQEKSAIFLCFIH